MNLKDIRQRYRNGDKIESRDLILSIPVLTASRDVLLDLGDEFHITWVELNRMIMDFESWLKARGEIGNG